MYAEIPVDSYWLHLGYLVLQYGLLRCKLSWFIVRNVSLQGVRMTHEAIISSGRPSGKIELTRLPCYISGLGI